MAEPELLVVDAPGGPTPDDLVGSLSTWGPVRVLMVRWNDEQSNEARRESLSRLGPVITVPRIDHVAETGLVLDRERPLAGVVAFSEVVSFHAGMLAALLGLPGHPPAALLATRCKDVQRAVLERAGVPSPRARAVRTAEDLDACADLRFPVVMKPSGGVSSFCMARAETPDELRVAWPPLVERYRAHPITHGTDPVFVVEEEIAWSDWREDPRLGHQVSVEILAHQGRPYCLGVTDKTPLVPLFREEGHLTPSSLSPDQTLRVVDVADRAVTALGLRDGLCHVELMLTATGPVVLEVNGRIGGGVHGLWRASRGYDCVRAAAAVATGTLPPLPGDPVRYAAYVRPQPPQGRHRVESIDRAAVEAALRRAQWGSVDKGVGTEIDTDDGGVANLARFIATADSQDELLTLVATINAELTDAVRLRPLDEPATAGRPAEPCAAAAPRPDGTSATRTTAGVPPTGAPMAEHVRDEFDRDEFFAEFWRRKPLFVKGGAVQLVGRSWRVEDFDAALASARAAGAATNEIPGQVTFLEAASSYDETLAGLAADMARVFGLPGAWFDAIRTHASSGIGAHFDHSDNFVLQQEGLKEWSLASPRAIDPDLLARRMLNDPSVGSHELPADRLHFVLEAGDLLYIPLMWLHDGVSHAGSLSISLVCPAMSLYSATIPFLTGAIKARGLGATPIPALHAALSEDERTAALKTLRDETARLLGEMGSQDLVDQVLARQARALQAVHR